MLLVLLAVTKYCSCWLQRISYFDTQQKQLSYWYCWSYLKNILDSRAGFFFGLCHNDTFTSCQSTSFDHKSLVRSTKMHFENWHSQHTLLETFPKVTLVRPNRMDSIIWFYSCRVNWLSIDLYETLYHNFSNGSNRKCLQTQWKYQELVKVKILP